MLRLTLRSARNNKKGDGLSLNVIVLAVLALLILVILSIIVLRGTSTFTGGVASCIDNNGQNECVPASQPCSQGYVKVPSSCTNSQGTGGFCCTLVNAPTGQ